MNRWIGIGRLTRDPELRYTPNGLAVTTFSIAIDRWGKAGEDGKKKTDFFDCVAWKERAELIAEKIGKGNRVCVEGRIEFDEWADKDTGKPRKAAKVRVESITIIDWKESVADSHSPKSSETDGTESVEDDPFQEE